MSRAIAAKFSGFCGRCRTEYRAGEDITKDATTGKWGHAVCPTPKAAPPPAVVPPLVLAEVAPLGVDGPLESSAVVALGDELLRGAGMALGNEKGVRLCYRGLDVLVAVPATEAQVREAAQELVELVAQHITKRKAETAAAGATAPTPAPARTEARRYNSWMNEGGDGFNPYDKSSNEVLADELEKDGRVRAVGGGRRVTVTGLRAPMLEGSAREVTEGREVRAIEVQALVQTVLEQARKKSPSVTAAEMIPHLATLMGAVESVLAREETRSGAWWMHRRPHPHESLGIVIHGDVHAVLKSGAHAPPHLQVTVEPLSL